MNLYERIDVSSKAGIPLADYKPEELTAFLIQKYPTAPMEKLDALKTNIEIGSVLYNKTKMLLRGLNYDKGNSTH